MIVYYIHTNIYTFCRAIPPTPQPTPTTHPSPHCLVTPVINDDQVVPLGGPGDLPTNFFFFINLLERYYFSVKKRIIHSHRDLDAVSSSTDRTNLLVPCTEDFVVHLFVCVNHKVEEETLPWDWNQCHVIHWSWWSDSQVVVMCQLDATLGTWVLTYPLSLC